MSHGGQRSKPKRRLSRNGVWLVVTFHTQMRGSMRETYSSIPKDKRGHLLTHQIQSSRKVNVSIHDINYSGIPVETCTTCHNRGKRIGVSYQGLMETEYQSTFDSEGNSQPNSIQKDTYTHRGIFTTQRGCWVQDWHTSYDMHGGWDLLGWGPIWVAWWRLELVQDWSRERTQKGYPWELAFGDYSRTKV